MAEYIERDAVIEKINHEALHSCYHNRSGEARGLMLAKDLLQKAPTADVEPVRRGHWIINSDGYYPQCSECMNEPQGRVMTDWCPNCGAKMGGEENEK